jgi:translocator protein
MMDTPRVVAGGAAVLIVLIYAVGSGVWVAAGRDFYLSLDRPPWQPPDVVFGLIWPYNFVALAVAGVVVASRGTSLALGWWLGLTALSVVAALAWARLFYINEALWPAAVALAVATLVTVAIVAITWHLQWWSGVLLLPYLIWLGTATSLAVGYAVRNPTV